MKKRLRKKLHKEEFQEIGISVRAIVNDDTVSDILENLADIAEDNKLIFSSGGAGHLILPSKEYGELIIPKKVEFLLSALMLDPYLLTDYVVGYYTDPDERKISEHKIEKVKTALSLLKAELEANYSIDLWN